ncbi:MAG: biotin--[acetyl-CoA-carboxylase] ligase [Nitrospirota bacterium]
MDVVNNISRSLNTKIIGKTIYQFKKVDSTNRISADMAKKGVEEGTVLIAEIQEKGRGRIGRSWFSPEGNIYLSIILRPALSSQMASLLTLIASISVTRVIRDITSLDAKIKWPNDIFIRNKKVGGILTELSADSEKIRYAVVGIGLNVNIEKNDLPEEISSVATSLREEAGRSIDRRSLVVNLLEDFELWYAVMKNRERDRILNEWKRLSDTIGRWVEVRLHDKKIEGLAYDITEDGYLKIRLKDNSLETVVAGDICY